MEESICKFSKKGLTPSQIGVILRDSHGIAQVKSVTGNKILRILKAHGTVISFLSRDAFLISFSYAYSVFGAVMNRLSFITFDFWYVVDEGLQPGIPEDLYFLIKKAVAIRKHLERNKKDKDSKFRLILVESRIHRLTRYYKRTKQVPATYK